MSGAHAFLPPSGAAAWVVCALWPTMNKRYPELGDKPEAREGTGAHWVWAEQLNRRWVGVGAITDNGVAVDEAMLEGAEMYVTTVSEAYASLRSVTAYHVEERVAIPSVHPNNWGTPDTWIFGHSASTGRAKLIVIDYKYGHEFVDVFENWQLIDYTRGILDSLDVDGGAEMLVDVEFIIVQPRTFHKDGPVRRWKTLAANLRAQFNILAAAAEAAHADKPLAKPEPGNCKHCPGRHACESLQREGYTTMALAGRSVPIEMPPAAQGLELKMLERAIELAQARASGLAEQIEHALMAGKPNPHYVMEAQPAKLTWTKPDAEIIALGKLLGADLAKPEAAITPTQAGKKLPPELLAVYSDRPRGALKLTPVSTTAARKVFG